MAELRNDLGDFLRTRRASLSPEETGVPTYGTPRRVPGLRREEVAMLAGVSVNYYTRLEQGESHQMSDSVLDALARALRLAEGERRHLERLAWPSQFTRRDPDSETGPETVRDSLRAMVEANTEQAVGIIGRHLDNLGGNRLWNALFGLRPDRRTNGVLRMFLDPAMRDLHVDWERAATELASYLRTATGEHPDDPALAAIIGELSIKSPDFVRIWARHPVAECAAGVHVLDHPVVGRLTLNDESLRVPDGAGQRVNFISPADDVSAERLRLLSLS
ncbi:helix-turn-helix transcriptional regulator [Kineosporia rhizophila]|uniref:helix-turn-helix domain-containing protein n=1 Tax=Kineosporia TaxID=49184 RepID=UPI001E4AEA6E|nr:helix-turn-helix transcriptional regulator [Kineosporia sp. NBRC 101677]MCE0536484.1 helix-turn-helix transcriptional regulator [Kineosporia rhizophila]